MLLLAAALAADPLDSVVFVQQGSSACAGTFIGDGRVLTAYHCVTHGGRPKITTRDDYVAIGRVHHVDRGRDIAVIDVPGFADRPGLALGPRPSIGDTVRALGHPFGSNLPLGFYEQTLRWSTSEGIVAAIGMRAIQTTAPINPGNSGGPLLDEQDRIIGVISRKLRGDGIGFAGRVDDRHEWIDQPRRPMGAGGVVGLEVLLQANGYDASTLSLGGRLEAAFRDRVVVSATAAFPLGLRWTAIDLGAAIHSPGELRLGLRQRLFRGSWAVRLDGYASGALIETVRRNDIDATSVIADLTLQPMFGGRIAARNLAFDFGIAPLIDDPFIRMTVSLRWPGTIGVL